MSSIASYSWQAGRRQSGASVVTIIQGRTIASYVLCVQRHRDAFCTGSWTTNPPTCQLDSPNSRPFDDMLMRSLRSDKMEAKRRTSAVRIDSCHFRLETNSLRITSGYATWFTAGGAIRIALRQLWQTWKLRHL